jgi:uncharacterized membrane protein (DUF485 family)
MQSNKYVRLGQFNSLEPENTYNYNDYINPSILDLYPPQRNNNTIENYTPPPDNKTTDASFELIPDEQPLPKKQVTKIKEEVVASINENKEITGRSLILFLILIIVFIAFELWVEVARKILYQKIHKGQPISIGRFILYAIIATIVSFAAMYFANVSFQGLYDW